MNGKVWIHVRTGQKVIEAPGIFTNAHIGETHGSNDGESLKWIEKVGKVEFPFLDLLRLAVQCRLSNGIRIKIDQNLLELKDHATTIINRILLDAELKNAILTELEHAGLTVKSY